MSPPYRLGKLTRKRADDSTYWSYCITWKNKQGHRQRYSLGTTDRVVADAQARKVWGTLNKAGHMETVGELVEAYLDSLKGKRDEYRKRSRWKQVKPYWAAIRPENIDDAVSLDYAAKSKKAVNTVRNELTLVRSTLKWAVREEHIANAPNILLPSMPDSKVGHLSKPQFRKFLAGCATPHVKLFAMLAVTTGGRKTAILEAKWDQVDFDRALFALNAEGRQQSHKHRATVPLNDRIMPALREAREGALTDYVIEHRGQPLRDIKKGIAAASQRSGVKAHPHMFRHSAAVWMAEARVPMAEIASYLGHKDMNVTTRVYAKFHPEYLRDAANSLTW